MGPAPEGTAIGALVVIGGSTASGKSSLSLALARAIEGVVVNADSQQLFADLPVLTAQPTPQEQALVRHRLYGVLKADEQPSVGLWLDKMALVLAECRASGRVPIVTGGSGLYLHALLHGMPDMPEIPPALRHELRAWAATQPPQAIHARLAERDPLMAARLHPSDPQRLLRALEVIEATGRSLAEWQALPKRKLALPGPLIGFALLPPAELVNPRIEARLSAMLAGEAPREVAALLERRPDALRLPIAKVHGLRELAAIRQGTLAPATGRHSIALQVRHYAKRQRTWFRHQLPELVPAPVVGEDPDILPALLTRLELLTGS